MKSESNLKGEYIRMLVKRNFIATIMLVLLLLVFLFTFMVFSEDNSLEDVLVGFQFIIIGAIGFILSILVIIRFNRLIKKQEEMFNVKFDDKGAKRVRTSIVFISDDWLIDAGTGAFYREYIKSFGRKKETNRRGAGPYKVIVNTIDGKKYYLKTPQTNDIDIYRKWLHKK